MSEENKPTTMREFLATPNQMLFWSKPEKIIEFLLIQAEFHYAGAGWSVSESGKALEDCAKKLIEIYGLDKQENE